MTSEELYAATLEREDGADTVRGAFAVVCWVLRQYHGQSPQQVANLWFDVHSELCKMADPASGYTAEDLREWLHAEIGLGVPPGANPDRINAENLRRWLTIPEDTEPGRG